MIDLSDDARKVFDLLKGLSFSNDLYDILLENDETLFEELDKSFGKERKVPDGPVDTYVEKNGVTMDVSGITALQHNPHERQNNTNIFNSVNKEKNLKEKIGVDSKTKSVKPFSLEDMLETSKDKRMGELQDQKETLSVAYAKSIATYKKDTSKTKQEDPNGKVAPVITDFDTGRDDDEEH